MSPLLELRKHSQSVWLDYIRRDLVYSGELKQLVEHDGLRGVTSNPTIFEKAIDGGSQLDAITEMLQVDGVASFASAYDRVLDAIGKKRREMAGVPA